MGEEGKGGGRWHPLIRGGLCEDASACTWRYAQPHDASPLQRGKGTFRTRPILCLTRPLLCDSLVHFEKNTIMVFLHFTLANYHSLYLHLRRQNGERIRLSEDIILIQRVCECQQIP